MTEPTKTLRLEKAEWQALALNGMSQMAAFVQGTNETSDAHLKMIDEHWSRIRLMLTQWHKTVPQGASAQEPVVYSDARTAGNDLGQPTTTAPAQANGAKPPKARKAKATTDEQAPTAQ